MPFIQSFTTNSGSHIALFQHVETEQELLTLYSLTVVEQTEYNAITKPHRRLQWLSTKIALQQVLQLSENILLYKDKHGKPFLKNQMHHISISHTMDIVAVIANKNLTVGIDIERIRKDITHIAPKFVHDDEASFLDQSQLNLHLHLLWAMKETVYKIHGKAGLNFKNEIRIGAFLPGKEGKTTGEVAHYKETLSLAYICLDEIVMTWGEMKA